MMIALNHFMVRFAVETIKSFLQCDTLLPTNSICCDTSWSSLFKSFTNQVITIVTLFGQLCITIDRIMIFKGHYTSFLHDLP